LCNKEAIAFSLNFGSDHSISSANITTSTKPVT
jgi:hypothetical protein